MSLKSTIYVLLSYYRNWQIRRVTQALIEHEDAYFKGGLAARDIFTNYFANRREEELRKRLSDLRRSVGSPGRS